MALSVTERAGLEAVKAATRLFTGQDPIVQEEGGRTVVSFTPAQAAQLRAVLEEWIDAPAGNLRIAWLPVVAPIVFRRGALWAGLFAGVSFFAGRFSKGR